MGFGSMGGKFAEKATQNLAEKTMESATKSFSGSSSSGSKPSIKGFFNNMKNNAKSKFFNNPNSNINSNSNTQNAGNAGDPGGGEISSGDSSDDNKESLKEKKEEIRRAKKEKREVNEPLKEKHWNNFLFILFLIIFIGVDIIFFNFSRDSAASMFRIFVIYLAYSFIFALKSFICTKDSAKALQDFFLAAGLSFAQVIVPFLFISYLVNFLPMISGFITLIAYICSPWLVYLLFFKHKEETTKLIESSKLILFLGIIALLIFMILPSTIMSMGKVSSLTETTVSPADAADNFFGLIKNQFNKIKGTLNSTMNPMDNLYGTKGQIDKNSNTRLGVFITDVRTLFDDIYENEEFNLLGKFEVNTLFNEIYVKADCFAVKNYDDKNKISGIINENNFYVYGRNIEILDCNFKNGLSTGPHQLYFQAEFNFETWAYADYTFVDRELAKQFLYSNRDINSELDIDAQVSPIYTDGPVKILLISAQQPVQVDFERSNFPKFGLEIQKNFLKGDVSKVNEIIIQTPKMINLKSCSFKGELEELKVLPEDFDVSLDDFNFYRFYNDKENSQALRTILCSMNIDESIYLSQKLNVNKLIKTIIVKTDYDYKIESDKKPIVIKKDPYKENVD